MACGHEEAGLYYLDATGIRWQVSFDEVKDIRAGLVGGTVSLDIFGASDSLFSVRFSNALSRRRRKQPGFEPVVPDRRSSAPITDYEGNVL